MFPKTFFDKYKVRGKSKNQENENLNLAEVPFDKMVKHVIS